MPRKATKKKPAVIEPKPQVDDPLRDYQLAAEAAFDAGQRNQFLGWHRRAGKDLYAMQKLRKVALAIKASYWYCFPKHKQGRLAIWEGIDKHSGLRIRDRGFPPELVKNYRDEDMFLELTSGSTVQFLGSDYYDRYMGAGVFGVVFSEWALCKPAAYDYIAPMLLENNGFALFPTTFRGQNHAWKMAEAMRGEPGWYVDVRTIEQTRDIHGKRIITDAMIAAERRRGVREARIQEEYYCNPNTSLDGAVYGRQIDARIVRAIA